LKQAELEKENELDVAYTEYLDGLKRREDYEKECRESDASLHIQAREDWCCEMCNGCWEDFWEEYKDNNERPF
jgi:hypothetical protein